MKSVRVDAFTPNSADLHVVDVPTPQPGPGEVRVRMRLAPVNPSDLNFVHGTYHSALQRVIWNPPGQTQVYNDPERASVCPVPPYALGGEGMGIVEATGSGFLAKRLLGKRVAIASPPPQGTWQEFAIADAKKCVALSDDISDEQGAMFFINPLTAYALSREVLKVPRDGWLLITAAGSALGKSMVRLGKRYGYKTLCVVRGPANSDALRALGADAVVETDHQDLIAEVHRITGGKGVGSAMDCVGGELTAQVVRCLGMNGHLVLYGTLANAPISLHVRDLMMPLGRVSGFYLANWLSQQSLLKRLEIIRAVTRLTRQGAFATEVTETFSIDDAARAAAAAVQPGRTGKVMLRMHP